MSKVQSLVKEKARIIGLKYRNLEVREATADDSPPLGERLLMDMLGEDIFVELVPPFSEDDPALEGIVENMLCQWKCAQEEGQYPVRLQLPDFKSEALVAELFNAYGHYVGGKRHISVFGEEGFRRYQHTGWKDFIRQVGELLVIPNADQQVATVASCFKEQIKFDLLGEAPEEMPKAIGKITAPFPSVFDTIRVSNLHWKDKVSLLVFTSAYLLTNVDLVRSYVTNSLVLKEPLTNVSELLTIRAESAVLEKVLSVEAILNATYGSTSQGRERKGSSYF